MLLSTLYSTQLDAQVAETPNWTWATNINGVPAVATADDGSLFTDNAGNSYVVNQVQSRVNIKKYDSLGSLVWNRTGSSGSEAETPTDITVDGAGNYYITGSYTGTATFGTVILSNTGQSDIFLVKYNADGVVQWAQKYGGLYNEHGNSIAVDASGNCFIGGYSYAANFTSCRIFYAKYNATGVAQWAKTDAGNNNGSLLENVINSLSIDSFGNSYFTGVYKDFNATQTFFIRKCDPLGNTVWQRKRSDTAVGNDIVTDNVGNSYVTGFFYSSLTNYEIFITKYDAAGQVIWSKIAGGPDKDYGDSIAIDANGNSYLSGRFQSEATFASIAISNLNSGISDIFVAKYDNLGDIVWVQQAGASGEEGAGKIALDGANNCYISGFYTTSATFGTTTLTGIVRQPLLAKIGNFVEGNIGISTLPLASRNYNAGSAISVPFSTRGTFPAGTIYTVELSDPTGSFFFPKNIGVGASSPISCVLPALTIPASDYRVRVICANPNVTGTDNGSAITINGNSQLTTPDWAWANNITGFSVATEDVAGSIFTDTAGNSYMINQVGIDINIKKYDSAGLLVWTRTGSSGTGTKTPTDITVDQAGNYYITGSFFGSAVFGSTTLIATADTDIFTVKYNTTGDVQWAVKYGTVDQDQSNSIAVDTAGNCYIGGNILTSTSRFFYAKYDVNGLVQWTKEDFASGTIATVLGGIGRTHRVKGISLDGFGNSYIVGSNYSTSTLRAFIRKCDPAGNTVWEKFRTEFSATNDIVTDGVGNSYVTGTYYDSENFNVFTTKYNAAGAITWTQNGIGSDADLGNGIALDAQGNCFVTGRFQHNTDFSTLNVSNTSSGISDVFVAKYNAAGSIAWLQQAGESGQDAGSKIGVDALGNCYVNGYYTTSTTFGNTTLNGGNLHPFIAKIGLTAETTLGTAVVAGGNFCGGAVVTIDYPITGRYNAGNVFTAQLSDATGSFANPLNIGTLNSVINTSIYAIIPLTTIAGTGYRVRVVSSNPALTGNNNEVDIRINQPNCNNNIVSLNSSPISAIEYFIDTDPGVGNGTALTTTGGQTIASNYNIVLPTLAPGFHNLFMRSKNADGKWGMYEGRVFYVQPATVALNSEPIVDAEYFFNNDPGVGSGNAFDSFPSSQLLNVTQTVQTTGLSQGFHNLFVRTKNATGKWSMYEGRVVYIQPTVANLTISPIVSAEYFFNTDPGVGAGTNINTGAAATSLELNIPNLATAPLQLGSHNVFIRVKNNEGKWSLAERRVFNICNNIVGSPVVAGTSTICLGSNLTLTAGNVTGATSYEWTGPNNFTATTQGITINSVSNLNAGMYEVVAVSGTGNCSKGNATKVNVMIDNTPAPTGNASQTFTVGNTVANIEIAGTDIKWYASITNASAGINPLVSTTLLENGVTYYANQVLNGCESTVSLAVTISIVLSSDEFDKKTITLYPNPATVILNIKTSNNTAIDRLSITDLSGKKIIEQNSNRTSINIESLAQGIYVLEVISEGNKNVSKFIKI